MTTRVRTAARKNHGELVKACPLTEATSYSLTDDEMTVLSLMVQGHYPKEISHRLELEQAEVGSRILSIRTKMSVRSTTEAAVKAIREHIVPRSADEPTLFAAYHFATY